MSNIIFIYSSILLQGKYYYDTDLYETTPHTPSLLFQSGKESANLVEVKPEIFSLLPSASPEDILLEAVFGRHANNVMKNFCYSLIILFLCLIICIYYSVVISTGIARPSCPLNTSICLGSFCLNTFDEPYQTIIDMIFTMFCL